MRTQITRNDNLVKLSSRLKMPETTKKPCGIVPALKFRVPNISEPEIKNIKLVRKNGGLRKLKIQKNLKGLRQRSESFSCQLNQNLVAEVDRIGQFAKKQQN